MIYLLLAILALVSAAALVLPLLRRPNDEVVRSDAASALYRAQLAELETDAARGLISPTEAEGARIEIQRRLLHENDRKETSTIAPGMQGKTAALVLAAVTVVAAAGLYAMRGHPDLLSAPAPDRLAAASDDADIDVLVLRMAERMEERPEDLQGWLLLGRTAQAVGRFDLSVRAYRAASEIEPDNAAFRIALGEALTAEAAGLVTEGAQAEYMTAAKLAPDHPAPRFQLGLADFQSRDFESAHMRWTALARETPSDAPLAPHLDRALERLAEVTGTTPAPPVAAPGPTAEDIEAAAQMSVSDRAQMIRGMVDGLAARLEDEPDDVDGWLRLARAYVVLGETGNARNAYQAALSVDPENADALAGLSSLAQPVQE